MKTERRTLDIQPNKAGKRFALRLNSDGTFEVWAECTNYAAHVHGGLSKTWRYCEMKMNEENARALFARKLKSSAKA